MKKPVRFSDNLSDVLSLHRLPQICVQVQYSHDKHTPPLYTRVCKKRSVSHFFTYTGYKSPPVFFFHSGPTDASIVMIKHTPLYVHLPAKNPVETFFGRCEYKKPPCFIIHTGPTDGMGLEQVRCEYYARWEQVSPTKTASVSIRRDGVSTSVTPGRLTLR